MNQKLPIQIADLDNERKKVETLYCKLVEGEKI